MISDSEQTGRAAAHLHADLVEIWQTDGPDQVWEILDSLNPDMVRTLVMAQIGSDARRF